MNRCAYRLSAPGLGQEVGANLGLMPSFYQGLFLSPTVVSGALKGAVFAAACYESWASASCRGARSRATTSFRPSSSARARRWSPSARVSSPPPPSTATLRPSRGRCRAMSRKVIMAAGAFVQGSSIELSADGPIRPPYAVYFSGRPDVVPREARHYDEPAEDARGGADRAVNLRIFWDAFGDIFFCQQRQKVCKKCRQNQGFGILSAPRTF